MRTRGTGIWLPAIIRWRDGKACGWMFFKKVKRVVDVEKAEEEFEERMQDSELEKGDRPAMIIAALLVFIPALLFVLFLFLAVIWLFFGRHL